MTPIVSTLRGLLTDTGVGSSGWIAVVWCTARRYRSMSLPGLVAELAPLCRSLSGRCDVTSAAFNVWL